MPELLVGVRRVIVLLGGARPSVRSACGVDGPSRALASLGYARRVRSILEESVERFRWQLGDFAFIALHGRFGEDGQVQTILERRGVPYTGSGPTASAARLQQVGRQGGVSPPRRSDSRGVVVPAAGSPGEWRSLADSVGYPLVVKPDQEGSSLGVSFVGAADGLIAACERAFSFGPVAAFRRSDRRRRMDSRPARRPSAAAAESARSPARSSISTTSTPARRRSMTSMAASLRASRDRIELSRHEPPVRSASRACRGSTSA